VATQNDSIVIKFDSPQSYQEMVAAVCKTDGYQEEIPDPDDPNSTVSNPQSKDQFVVERVAGFLTSKKQAVIQAAVPEPDVQSGILMGPTTKPAA
jgi:hypothetical protein